MSNHTVRCISFFLADEARQRSGFSIPPIALLSIAPVFLEDPRQLSTVLESLFIYLLKVFEQQYKNLSYEKIFHKSVII